MKRISITKERLYLTILWIISIVFVSIPWATADGEMFIGWFFVQTFSITYLIGLIIGLVVLITNAKPFVLSLIAGILMIIGVLGGAVEVLFMNLTIFLLKESTVEYGAGIGFAFIWSVVYTVVASYLGKRMKRMAEK